MITILFLRNNDNIPDYTKRRLPSRMRVIYMKDIIRRHVPEVYEKRKNVVLRRERSHRLDRARNRDVVSL